MKTKDAIEQFGSQQALADALRISRQAVGQWGEEVPPLRAYQIRDLLSDRHSDIFDSDTAAA